jgi:carboxyl-terminal processing protease
MPQRNLIMILLATAVSYACYVRGGQNPYARYVATGLAAIEQDSLEPVPSEELFDGAMQGMVDVLRRHGDEHSQYLPSDEADPLRSEIRQQFGGIGVRIRMTGDPPRLTIAGPPDPGTPAARANLLPGDHIQMIDGRSTSKLDLSEVLPLLRGEPGTVVRLAIQHEHQPSPRTVELVREIITIESILGDVRDAEGRWQFRLPIDSRIAHLRITLFGDRTAEELGFVLNRLTAEGVRAIALDVRDNAGGALEAAVAVCDLFLRGGLTIVETRGQGAKLLKRYVTSGDGPYLSLPVAVVVNQNSASAAEIVAACLQDHRRAVVVGQRTYGKGTVQQLLPLAGDSLLKLTWASFWRPSGVNMHRSVDAPDGGKWGVVPDVGYELRLSADEYAAYRRYRNERDLLGYSAESEVAAQEGGSTGTPDSVDEQIMLAVEYLQGVLDG